MKYEFTGKTKVENGVTLRQIKRLSDGLIGGWIEKEENLSQDGDCFVSGDARVYGNARVFNRIKIAMKMKFNEKTKYLFIDGWKYPITIFKTHLAIGCYFLTIKNWEKKYLEIAKYNNIDAASLKFCKKLIETNLKFL